MWQYRRVDQIWQLNASRVCLQPLVVGEFIQNDRNKVVLGFFWLLFFVNKEKLHLCLPTVQFDARVAMCIGSRTVGVCSEKGPISVPALSQLHTEPCHNYLNKRNIHTESTHTYGSLHHLLLTSLQEENSSGAVQNIRLWWRKRESYFVCIFITRIRLLLLLLLTLFLFCSQTVHTSPALADG